MLFRKPLTALLGAGAVMLMAGAAEAHDRWGYDRYHTHDRYGAVPDYQKPPPHLCRVWYEGVPEWRQPAPVDCRTAERQAAYEGGKIIYGTQAAKHAFNNRRYDDRRYTGNPYGHARYGDSRYDNRYDRNRSAYNPANYRYRCSDRDRRRGVCGFEYAPHNVRYNDRNDRRYDDRYRDRYGRGEVRVYRGY